MNIRKNIDYTTMFAAIDAVINARKPQMELYCELGHLVSNRPEKGAAVAAAEYLAGRHPDATGFSPRNLRRMRDFYRMYEESPELLELTLDESTVPCYTKNEQNEMEPMKDGQDTSLSVTTISAAAQWPNL